MKKMMNSFNPAVYYAVWTFIVAIYIYIASGEDVSDPDDGWISWMTQAQGQVLAWGYVGISILIPFFHAKWFKQYWWIDILMLIVGIALAALI